MQLEEFCNKVKEELEQYAGSLGVTLEIRMNEVCKNNGVKLKGICVKAPNEKVAPNIYLNTFWEAYENGTSMGKIVESVYLIYEKNKVNNMDLEYFVNYDRVRGNIVYKLIHFEKNKELLKDVPYMRYLDMAVVFYYLLEQNRDGSASILIRQEHLNLWKVSKNDVFKDAAVNTPKLLTPKITSMTSLVTECCMRTLEVHPEKKESVEMIMDDMKYMEEMHPSCMYVLSNGSNYYGAACVLYRGVLQEFAKKIHSNLFVLPSSVHEVILVPTQRDENPEYLADMVREVNACSVLEEERLSDHVYYYDRETDEMKMSA